MSIDVSRRPDKVKVGLESHLPRLMYRTSIYGNDRKTLSEVTVLLREVGRISKRCSI